MNILVIDDSAEIREVIYKILQEEGHDVAVSINGKEALKLLKLNPRIDLVITDIIMPEKEGIETIIELKRDYPKIRIMAISGGGYGNAGDYLVAAKRVGADSTLCKPFDRQELIDTLQAIFD
ncbi:MAG: response regulator [Deltaproteobacteria bacterium]|nr:response regulator [Deltaproteobacteria bacterium]